MNPQKTANTLEDILRECFCCKKPFDKNKNQTIAGVKAYDKLIITIYGLENIGVINNANNIITQLDNIISREYY